MKTVYSERHAGHQPEVEYWEGELLPFFESPQRAEIVLEAVRHTRLGPVIPPADFGLAPILAVHDPEYVAYLRGAYGAWIASGRNPRGVHPDGFAVRHLCRRPASMALQAGYYSQDVTAVITPGTWEAALAAAHCALTAAGLVREGEPAAFALCRPPGHHAHSDLAGGYCFLNNAAIAAHWLTEHAARAVAILDVDFHHGNGTQQIFYRRAEVLYVSLHADPDRHYPYFLGAADERGEGPGLGRNINYPLPAGIEDDAYLAALAQACQDVRDYAPGALVVSLGVDTFGGDPIADFALTQAAYPRMGALMAQLRLPTVFIMEGGYAVEQLGANVAAVLAGFEGCE